VLAVSSSSSLLSVVSFLLVFDVVFLVIDGEGFLPTCSSRGTLRSRVESTFSDCAHRRDRLINDLLDEVSSALEQRQETSNRSIEARSKWFGILAGVAEAAQLLDKRVGVEMGGARAQFQERTFRVPTRTK
jgi:hypothetical protein